VSPIVGTDIVYRLSGGAANVSPAASLGGARSTAGGGIITSGVANNLWDDVSGDESALGDTEYRGIYVVNNHGTLPLQNAKLWIDSLTASANTEFDIALAGEGLNGTMETVSDESTPPTGETFTRPTTKAGGLSLGSIPPTQHYGIWIKRTVDPGAAAASDSGSIRVEGDTAP
jgi:hypothetical protein